MSQCKIAVIEDQKLFRELIVNLVGQDEQFELVGQASTGPEGLELCRKTNPDLLLLDLGIPEMDGFEVAQTLIKEFPALRIMVLSGYDDPHTLAQVMELELHGYVDKNQPFEVLQDAMRTVARGELYFTEVVKDARRVLERDPEAFTKILSQREQEVLRLVAQGMTSNRIAERLELSVRTVQVHRLNIHKKMGFKSLADLIKFAVAKGFDKIQA